MSSLNSSSLYSVIKDVSAPGRMLIGANPAPGQGIRPSAQIGEFPNHSQLAMKAARRMRQSKQKIRTGHTVCKHLLMMLSEPVEKDVVRASRKLSTRPAKEIALNSATGAANDRQFDLF